MACPFGFTANDADDEDEVTSEEEEENEENKSDSKSEAQGDGPAGSESAREEKPSDEAKPEPSKDKCPEKKPKKKKVAPEDLEFDFDKDPVSWFYQNQIKSEAEFSMKKDALRAEARKRLDQIMSKKDKRVEWPDDSDLDELSIRSSELSELDSDVDSLGSIISCANSWIEDARYGTPAEKTLQWAAYIALGAICYSLYLSMGAVTNTRKVMGVLVNSAWPLSSFLAGGLLGTAIIAMLLGIRYRSRRFLLGSQAALLMLYSAFLVIVCGVVFRPTAVDAKLREVACTRYNKSDQGSRLCKMLPGIERDLSEQMQGLMWAGALAATCALACLTCSVWYHYELSYIEKKAIKHKKRHKRRKHSIPWDKIKIVGPVTNCGANGPKGGAAGGKCPVAHTGASAPAAASKCPVAGFGKAAAAAPAVKAAGEKKND